MESESAYPECKCSNDDQAGDTLGNPPARAPRMGPLPELDKTLLRVIRSGLQGPQPRAETIMEWVRSHQVQVVNIAGPRESQSPGIYAQAAEFLREVFSLG